MVYYYMKKKHRLISVNRSKLRVTSNKDLVDMEVSKIHELIMISTVPSGNHCYRLPLKMAIESS